MTKLQAAEQLRRAIQMFAASVDDSKAMEIAAVFPPWEPGRSYAIGERLIYGTNSVGDPQLYKVAQSHTSSAEWTPDAVAALYTPIGIGQSGYDQWVQPSGAHDAYVRGDIVEYHDRLYICVVDSTVYAPDVYGWEEYHD